MIADDRKDALRQVIGENVKRFRKLRGLTHQTLGDKCGLSRTTILRLEQGTQGVKDVHLYALADALEVATDDLRTPATVSAIA